MTRIVVPDTLRGERVRLRALREEDGREYARAFRADRELGRLLGLESDPDEVWARLQALRSEEAARDGEWVQLAVCEADAFVGVLSLLGFDWQHRRCDLGYWLAAHARGRGVGRAACELALGWAFDELDLLRVEISVTTENTASQALARSLGFTREAVRRGRDLDRGVRVDVIEYGLLREDRGGRI